MDTQVGTPVTHTPPPREIDVETLRRRLEEAVDGEVRFDTGSRAAYSTDASNYRQVPIGVVVPRHLDAGVAAVSVCRARDVPVLSRGGGTSLAGQCCNAAVVIDWSKHCGGVELVDVPARRIVVQAGAVLDHVNHVLEPEGLMVGPKPSSHRACTIGGMIGNDSCGASAQAYGKMADSVLRLEILTYDGVRAWVGPTGADEYARIQADGGRLAQIYRQLRDLRDDTMELVRTRFPRLERRVSGYNLDQLLPENGFNLARALVGSEGTLVTVLRAELAVVPRPAARALAVLGFQDIFTAADAVPSVAAHRPLALEAMDETMYRLARAERPHDPALRDLPPGAGWLLVQFGGDTADEARQRAEDMMRDLCRGDGRPPPSHAFLGDPAREDELWRLRESGLGVEAYPPTGRQTYEGWSDAAVPPERLGAYLRDYDRLRHRHGYAHSALYGHFGQGCVHGRLPLDLHTDDGIARYRRFAEEGADLVASYGGSLSGEHGDGQALAELLPRMFGAAVVEVFGRVKAIFDPRDRMNPGKVVYPHRLDQDLAQRHFYPLEPKETFFGYPDDHGRFGHAATRCVGTGKCRKHPFEGGVMCPSYRVTREEEHSTRGRARLLEEMVRGELITDGWRSEAVRDALDLCLACKGCRAECPVNVDMATYKAEFLAHHYRHRLRPVAHYSMGWLPLWAALASGAPHVVNAVTRTPGLSRLVKLLAGVSGRRALPRFAGERFTDWFKGRGVVGPGTRGRVVLWADTFSNNFDPRVGRAAVEVLEAAGFEVHVPPVTLCCGLTWISTGQLGIARRVLARSVRALLPWAEAGVPVVGLEPSCTAVFRSDGPELLNTAQTRLVSERTLTLSELLEHRAPDWRPSSAGGSVLAQVHCHQSAVMGYDADRAVLARFGFRTRVLDSGCCGQAGNFGFEREHYDVSVACAEQGLWPAVRSAGPMEAILADGFSCRTQIAAARTGREGRHLAEILAAALTRPH
ncbi:FAD-binding and (Fe-S)-binding domain-containing protein [Nonomuraea gerenzanensis]|uniref:Glycolate dehydrogenase, subunit GlcD n=1 Tax=Nonomuraea gerenzanensis TaxID=93944 RepID=A0A1M4E8W1_9ACTN|nr:FAD-binding and (Fe-S)-binding domain-containing protein [Nonomuraea gerenzanensis]UBU17458.1 FAD-binding protein [Nonomuraea gerenzanensis]SBO95214.1 Glycolate dehydrogenase, subunit GlcD [Nonomuraea gerenzanensis]